MAIDGIINIYKEKGMTSHDVVGRVRRIIGERRVGHTGTLDPMATGVLPVCVGRSAKVISYLETDLKRYRCEMKLGKATETFDVWGDVTVETPIDEVDRVTQDMVEDALSGFTGKLLQSPPLYSAVKVSGKRLYEYARKGKEVEIPKREVFVTDLKLISSDLGKGYDSTVTFDCECTKGTFIRSICNDVGEKLGVHAAMSALERTASGTFTIDEAVTLDELNVLAAGNGDGTGGQKVRSNDGADRQAARSEDDTCADSARSEDALKRVVSGPDRALSKLGSIKVAPKDALRLINGLEIEPACYEVEKKPYYLEHDFYFPVSKEIKTRYRIYSEIGKDFEIPGRPNGTVIPESERDDGLVFVGIAEYDRKTHHMIPVKVFI